MSRLYLCLIAGIISVSLTVHAAVIRVPGNHETIQAALYHAVNWDDILVADGTDTGNGNKELNFHGKIVVLESENGADRCIIDCENNGRGFNLDDYQGELTVIRGFTVINGNAGSENGGGGGIYLYGSNSVFKMCGSHWLVNS